MRKLILGAILLFSILSCDNGCSTVIGHDIYYVNGQASSYYLELENGDTVSVSRDTWLNLDYGDTYCE